MGNATFSWVDTRQRSWTLTFTETGLTLSDGDQIVQLPRDSWGHDIAFFSAGSSVIIRFQGPDQDVGFQLRREEALPFLEQLGGSVDSETLPASDGEPQEKATQAFSWFANSLNPGRRVELLWPKVTPLVVWALICASLAFLPTVGLLFGASAIILLILFFRRERQTAALRHARVIAAWAGGLVLWGTAISLLASWGFKQVQAGKWPPLDSLGTPGTTNPTAIMVLSFVVVIASLSVHEVAHAITAWWCGDDLARSLGRVTLNPIAHIDLFGTILLPAMLAYANLPTFGYAKPVPTRLGGVPNYRRAHILVALAGPGSNLLLAAFSLSALIGLACLLRVMVPEAEISGYSFGFRTLHVAGFSAAPIVAALVLILKLVFTINLYLACFNLVPIPPLDGSWIIEHLYPRTLGPFYAWLRPYGFFVFIGLIYLNAFDVILAPVHRLTIEAFGLIYRCAAV